MIKKILIAFLFYLVIFNCSIFPKNSVKTVKGTIKPYKERIQGFIGSYHPYKGVIYGGFGWKDGELVQRAFNFGENAIISRNEYSKYTFRENVINNCEKWNVNKVYGSLAGVSEKGAVNQPDDTLLWQPVSNFPGMIQGAHRFSELSKIYPQIRGVIIDDFYSNYPKTLSIKQLREIKDALLGKHIDANGNVDHNSKATTPNLKLYIVVYTVPPQMYHINPEVLKLIDGVSLWPANQNESYKKFDSDIKIIKKNYPGKTIFPGVYVYNNKAKYLSPESIRYLVNRTIDLYNKGEVNGLLVFSPVWFSKDMISKDEWMKLALPRFLDSVYYPYLGEAEGKVIDRRTGKPIEKMIITVSRTVNKKNFIVAKKLTNNLGEYNFGAWADKNNSGIYEIRFEKPLYKTKTIYVKLIAGHEVVLPDIKIE